MYLDKNRSFIFLEHVKTLSVHGRNLYHIHGRHWWRVRADWHRLTHKQTRFTLIPEVRHRASTTELRPLKLLPGKKPEEREEVIMRKNKTNQHKPLEILSESSEVTFHCLRNGIYHWRVSQWRSQSVSQCPFQCRRSTLCDPADRWPEMKQFKSESH